VGWIAGQLGLALVSDAYFAVLDETPLTGRYRAGPATVGPWAPGLQHGGPPNALAVAAAERAVRAETGRQDVVALRLAAEFVGAVPVGDIRTSARVVRVARSAALVEVVLSAGDREHLHARVWFVRTADSSAVAPPLAEPVEIPEVPPNLEWDFGYARSVERRFVRELTPDGAGAAAWARPRLPLVEGRELFGLERVAMVADSASGISAELDWREWSFVNVDLDIHLSRPFGGEWVLMDAVTHLGQDGSGLTRSTLSDRHGVVGYGLQTLVLAPIRSSA
jgi:acyl-coenzyme A thioesterase PaaI-like protein